MKTAALLAFAFALVATVSIADADQDASNSGKGKRAGATNRGDRGMNDRIVDEGDETTEDVTCPSNQVAKRNKRGEMVCKCTHGFRGRMTASGLVCTAKANTRTTCKSGRPYLYGCAEGETAPCCSGCKKQKIWTKIGDGPDADARGKCRDPNFQCKDNKSFENQANCICRDASKIWVRHPNERKAGKGKGKCV